MLLNITTLLCFKIPYNTNIKTVRISEMKATPLQGSKIFGINKSCKNETLLKTHFCRMRNNWSPQQNMLTVVKNGDTKF